MGRTRYCRPGQRLIPARTLLISRSGGSGDLQGAFWGRRALGSLPPGYVDRVLAPIFGGSGEAAGPPRVLDVDDGWCSWHLGAAGVMRIHLDTDLGGDPDDACALAMLLGWPGVEVVGITTTIDPGGRRAGCVAHCLQLAGRDDIGVAAGAGVSLTTLRRADPVTDDERYWPSTLAARPSLPGAALDLLDHSVEQGATIIGIGPYTNLALLEVAWPGSLGRVPVVVMGGWTQAPERGLPAWGPEMDWNVQWDTRAAEVVAAAATHLTLAALPATLKAHLREIDLPRLRASGPLGELLARQSEAHAHDHGIVELAKEHSGL